MVNIIFSCTHFQRYLSNLLKTKLIINVIKLNLEEEEKVKQITNKEKI
jgi:hypothetical protein